MSEIHGKRVPYLQISEADYITNLVAAGFPQPFAEFALGWVYGINSGEWDNETGELEKLIGHPPMSTAAFLGR